MAHEDLLESLTERIASATDLLAPHVRRTPLERCEWLSECTGADVRLKLENLQLTGSFKLRGAFHKVLTAEAGRGFVTASTGNHAAAMVQATEHVGRDLTIFVPVNAAPGKIERLERRGLAVHRVGEDCTETETAARRHAEQCGDVYVSPYNDLDIVAGQGTLGLEIAAQWPEVDEVYLALGGGGLAGGCAAALKGRADVIACSPSASAVMMESVREGKILDLPSLPTISDGTAGGVEADSVTFDLCAGLIDRYETATEDEIEASLVRLLREHHTLIEGAAAVPVAVVERLGRELSGRRVAVVLCGANIDLSTLQGVLERRTS